ncbi:hypothetical protein MLD38_036427 [Melastoma candidum]|uniref:Uncharacterized protein n=1 Tax=Melastoma candidum TaxID=119954 RepID=A0ACB9LLI9_9MYRT|nr:hypothetical protein MLD38_036427 [Melastoma candidum]
MAYEDDPYLDEDGEPLMDYDDMQSDGEQPQDTQQQQQHDHFLDDNLEDDIGEEDGWRGNWRDREPSSFLGYDPEQSRGKPRKRLVKKGADSDPRSSENSRFNSKRMNESTQPAISPLAYTTRAVTTDQSSPITMSTNLRQPSQSSTLHQPPLAHLPPAAQLQQLTE